MTDQGLVENAVDGGTVVAGAFAIPGGHGSRRWAGMLFCGHGCLHFALVHNCYLCQNNTHPGCGRGSDRLRHRRGRLHRRPGARCRAAVDPGAGRSARRQCQHGGRRLPPAARTRGRRDRGPARHPGAGPAGDHATLAARPRRPAGGARPVHRQPGPGPAANRRRTTPGDAQRLRRLLYGEPAVSPELAEYARASLTADGVPAEHFAVTAGALDGIERVLTAHLRPGDRVAVEDPGWANLLDLLAALGFSAEPVRVDDDGPLAADVARALRRGVRAVVVTTRAQNPTGAAVSAGAAQRSCVGYWPTTATCCWSKTTIARVSPASDCTRWPGQRGTGRSSGRQPRHTAPT